MADNLGADPAFVPAASSRQGVSTEGFNRGESEPSEFVWGYLIACANMMNLHDEPVIAADTLGELGVERSILRRMDISDYDLKPLNQLFDELERR